MAYPTKDELEAMLEVRAHTEIVDEILLTGIPFAFQDSPGDYDVLLAALGSGLGVAVTEMTVIGSGRIGFSLSPEKYGIAFSPESDVDVVVVSADLFDAAWFDLLRLGPKYFGLQARVRDWIDTHRQSNIFWGFIVPDRLSGAIALSPTWFRTFRGLARQPSLAGRDVNGRLYRTWDHVRIHQLNSLRKVQRKLHSGA